MNTDHDQDAVGADMATFIDRALEAGAVWGLCHPEGWALSESAADDAVLVIPLWSGEQYAAACATGDWVDYRVETIALDDLLEQWLPGLEEDGYRVGVDWSTELDGVEVPPLELQADFERAIEQLDAGD